MNVCFCFNERFVPGFISTAVSFCVNNKGHQRFFCLHDGISEKAKMHIMHRLSKFDCSLAFTDIGSGYFERDPYTSLPRYQKLSMARLMLHRYLPNDLERVLYLDADLTINRSIEEFYNTEFGENALVAIGVRRDGNDGGPYWDQEAGVYQFTEAPIKEESLYFNAGVMLLNLKAFRWVSISDYDSFVNRYFEKISLADQDILNVFFEDNSLRIVDRRLNCTIPNNMRLRKGEYKWIKEEVIVLHYVVATKPWMYTKYTNPLFKIYMRYYRHEAGLVAWIYRYVVWYALKPFHTFLRCWKKGLRFILQN